jgi:hypothetical protein
MIGNADRANITNQSGTINFNRTADVPWQAGETRPVCSLLP